MLTRFEVGGARTRKLSTGSMGKSVKLIPWNVQMAATMPARSGAAARSLTTAQSARQRF